MNLKSILLALVAVCTLSAFANVSDQDVLSLGQQEENLYLVINTNELFFNPNGSTQKVSVTSNVDWTVTTVGGGDWLAVTPASGKGSGEIIVIAKPNSGSATKSAIVTITAGILTQVIDVTQEGNGYLVVNKTEMKYTPIANSQTFCVSCNVTWDINVDGALLEV